MIHKVLIGIPTSKGYKRLEHVLQSIFNRTDKDIDFMAVICDDSGKQEHRDNVKNVVDKYSSVGYE